MNEKKEFTINESSTAAPVTNDVMIRMMQTLALIAGWIGHIVDAKGAFLHGEFENNEQIYANIPQGFEKHWDPRAHLHIFLYLSWLCWCWI